MKWEWISRGDLITYHWYRPRVGIVDIKTDKVVSIRWRRELGNPPTSSFMQKKFIERLHFIDLLERKVVQWYPKKTVK